MTIKTVEDTVREALQTLSPCPRYETCVTARVVSSLNCSIYGCNVTQEHTPLNKIYSELNINGDLKRRRQVIQIVRNEVTEERYQFEKHKD